MARTAARSGWRHAVAAIGLGLLILAAPSAVAAADEPVTGKAVAGAGVDPNPWPDARIDAGPVLLLLVAGTLALLGILSGPEIAVPARRPDARLRGRSH